MSRLPFDPGRMANLPFGGEQSPPSTPVRRGRRGDEEAPLTVSQLAVLINRALEGGLPPTVRLVGEIGQFRERTHWYFDLKDAESVLSCVMFASAARRAGFVPRQGQQVVLTGHVEFYERSGRTQFMADRIEPVGAGALDLAFRQLCNELRELGWFDEQRKRPLPLLPRRVAVVTSRTGAALQDVLDTAWRRCPSTPIALVDVRVQGEGAAAQIADAIDALASMRREWKIDVILVTRGGGSMEDLWAFNERIVAEAIHECPVPVVAAIGHETDVTIAELVADVRAATPTQAAMRIFPDAADLRRQLRSMGHRLTAHARRVVRFDRERLRSAARHPFFAAPEERVRQAGRAFEPRARELAAAMRSLVRDQGARLDRLSVRLAAHRPAAVYAKRDADLCNAQTRLHSAMMRRLQAADPSERAQRLQAAIECHLDRRLEQLRSAARGLDLVGPHSVLKRGYSVTLDVSGRVVRSTAEIGPGQRITTRLADGTFESEVVDGRGGEAIRPLSTRAARAAAKPRRSPPGSGRRGAGGVGGAGGARGGGPDQLDLFGGDT